MMADAATWREQTRVPAALREYDCAKIGDRYALIRRDPGTFWEAMFFTNYQEEAVALLTACRGARKDGQLVTRIVPDMTAIKRLA